MAKISQAEARRLKKRVEELEANERTLFGRWTGTGYPGGVNIGTLQQDVDDWFFGSLKTARRLGCALVATISDNGVLTVYAVKPQ